MTRAGGWDGGRGPFNALRLAGFAALIGGAATIAVWLVIAAVFIGPITFWFAWNVLDFGPAVGLPELGFWAILLAALFLILGWLGKVLIAAIVFIADPGWFGSEATVRWPEPTLRNFIAVALLAALAARPHNRARDQAREQRAKQGGRSWEWPRG